MFHRFATVMALLTALTSTPSTALAQFEIASYFGSYLPTGAVIEEGADPLGGLTRDRYEHRPAVAYGGRLTFWFSGRLGLEASLLATGSTLSYVSGDPLNFAGQPATAIDYDARVLAVTGRVRLRLGSPGTPLAPHVLGGLGVIKRSGRAYDGHDIENLSLSLAGEVEGTSDLVGVIGAGLSIELTRHLRIRLDLEDYISSAGFRLIDTINTGTNTVVLEQVMRETDSRLQNEIVLSQALVVSIGGR